VVVLLGVNPTLAIDCPYLSGFSLIEEEKKERSTPEPLLVSLFLPSPYLSIERAALPRFKNKERGERTKRHNNGVYSDRINR